MVLGMISARDELLENLGEGREKRNRPAEGGTHSGARRGCRQWCSKAVSRRGVWADRSEDDRGVRRMREKSASVELCNVLRSGSGVGGWRRGAVLNPMHVARIVMGRERERQTEAL